MLDEIGLNECFYKRFERCNSVVTAWWWRTHKTYQDEMKFSVWWKRGGEGNKQMLFFVLFSNQINSLQKIYIAIHKCTAFYECLVALIVCSRDYTACSSTQHPPHLQTSRCHPLRKTEQQPLYLSSQSNVPVRRDRQTDSDQTDFVSPIWPRHASDFAQD